MDSGQAGWAMAKQNFEMDSLKRLKLHRTKINESRAKRAMEV
jgi:hypothetical protein